MIINRLQCQTAIKRSLDDSYLFRGFDMSVGYSFATQAGAPYNWSFYTDGFRAFRITP